jgi:hypothetical protein
MTFPQNIDTFTTKIDGVTDVLASDINSLQASLVATQTKLGISGSNDPASVDYQLKGSAKAWVNFNGTGAKAIRSSFGILGITDSGTGQHRIHFLKPTIDTNFAPIITCSGAHVTETSKTTTSLLVQTYSLTITGGGFFGGNPSITFQLADFNECNVSIFS